jgi:hypothetical protein
LYDLRGSHRLLPAPRSLFFRYRLRRLSAGVMGRTVLVYSPEETPIVSEK